MITDAQTLITAFVGRMERNGVAPGTVRKYRSAVEHYMGWLDGRDPAAQRSADVERYLDEWHETSNAASATVRARVAALAKFYGYLDSADMLVDGDGRELRNPLDRVERPRGRRKAIDWLTAAEDAAILNAPIDARERIVVALLRWTGARVGEACSLCWSDVDESAGCLRVRTSKTDSGVRSVPLLPELAEELRSWRRFLEQAGLFLADGPVLCTSNRTPMRAQFAWRLVKRVARRAGVRVREDGGQWNVSRVTPHTFRKTFATDLLNRGVRIETVSAALGHADTRVTQEHYAQLLDATAQDEILTAMRRRRDDEAVA